MINEKEKDLFEFDENVSTNEEHKKAIQEVIEDLEEIVGADLDNDQEKGESKEHIEAIKEAKNEEELLPEEPEEVKPENEVETTEEESEEDSEEVVEDPRIEVLTNQVNELTVEVQALQAQNEALKTELLELHETHEAFQSESLLKEFKVTGPAYELVKGHLSNSKEKRNAILKLKQELPSLFNQDTIK